MLSKRLFFDSSVWIANFLAGDRKVEDMVSDEENVIFTSVLSAYEIAKFFTKRRATGDEIRAALGLVHRRSTIIGLDEKICIKAAEDSTRYGLYAVDAIILRSALESNATLVTADKDFRSKGVKDIVLVGSGRAAEH